MENGRDGAQSYFRSGNLLRTKWQHRWRNQLRITSIYDRSYKHGGTAPTPLKKCHFLWCWTCWSPTAGDYMQKIFFQSWRQGRRQVHRDAWLYIYTYVAVYITVLCLQKAEWLPVQNADDCRLKPVVRENKQTDQSETDLASIVVNDEALIPAVEVFMGVDLDSELLQHRLVGPLAHGMHGGANIIQDAHDARRILGITVNFRFLICYSLKTFFWPFSVWSAAHVYTTVVLYVDLKVLCTNFNQVAWKIWAVEHKKPHKASISRLKQITKAWYLSNTQRHFTHFKMKTVELI